jgi:hypothetical protein
MQSAWGAYSHLPSLFSLPFLALSFCFLSVLPLYHLPRPYMIFAMLIRLVLDGLGLGDGVGFGGDFISGAR